MTIAARMRTRLATLPGKLGESWTYRKRTSAPGVEPRTYGSWLPASALFTAQAAHEEFVDLGQSSVRKDRGSLRVPESIVLADSDQVLAPDGVTCWAVVGEMSRGYGTIRYIVEREFTLQVQANRGGVL